MPKQPTLYRSTGHVTYPLLTLSPLTALSITQLGSPFDLHVLATPPAFVLSQDQTLQFELSNTVPKDRVCQKKALHFSSIRTESADVLNTPNLKAIQGKRIRLGCCTFATTYFGLTVNLSKNLSPVNCFVSRRRKQTLYSFVFSCQLGRVKK